MRQGTRFALRPSMLGLAGLLALIAATTFVAVRLLGPPGVAHVGAAPKLAVSSVRVGAKVPIRFTLRVFGTSRHVALASLLGGHPAVINLFASWCPACDAELATFASVARKNPGVRFVGIDTNDPNSAKLRDVLTHAHVAYPVLLDTPQLGVASAFGVANLPTTLYVSGNGRLLATALGSQSAAQLEHEVHELP